jgi:nucleotide-binding universal stress UspA family protein
MTQPRTRRTADVVVGMDRTGTHDRAVLTAALNHAHRSHADVCIVHAIALDDRPPAALPDAAARDRQISARHDHIRAATADLRRQVAHLGAHNTVHDDTVHYDIRYGDPATVILAAAQHAALIVVGTRSDANHGSPLLLGTVSQDVAVHATCPVLLIPTAPTS